MWALYALLSSIFAAGVAIVGKLGLKNLDSTLATTIRSVIMALFLVIVSVSLKKFRGFSLGSLTDRDLLFIIAAGIFGALSWLFYFFALKNGPATPVVAIDRLSIIFVLAMAAMFLGESLTFKSIVGALMMVGGAILITLH